ncbi:MAG: hypothetical protein NXI31_24100 [bacterium]|nr:hypothetical protein [bacterium]
MAVVLLATVVWFGWQLVAQGGVEPTRNEGGTAADSAATGDGATAGSGVAPTAAGSEQRDSQPPSVRLVLGSGGAFPDGAVLVLDGRGEREVRLVSGELDAAFEIGAVTLRSLASPPCFREVSAELQAGRNVLAPVPMAQLRLKYEMLAGHECTPHAFDCAAFAISARAVEAAAQRRMSPDEVIRDLEKVRGEALVDGLSVPADGSECLFAMGADVVRVMPAHKAWYGDADGSTARALGGGVPLVGGSRTPVTRPFVAVPGTTVEVTIVLEPAGTLELMLAGWPQRGRTSIVLRRAGAAGAETVTRSWKTADRRTVHHGVASSGAPNSGTSNSGAPNSGAPNSRAPNSGASNSGADGASADRVVFDGLTPGVYRVDAVHVHGFELTCALLITRVETSGRATLELARGMGRQALRIGRGSTRGGGNLLIQVTPTAFPARGQDVPPAGNLVTVRLNDWTSDDLVVTGLSGTSGMVSWIGTTGRSVMPFDLARGSRLEFR